VLRIVARTNVGGPAQQISTLTTRLDPARFASRLLVGYVEPDEMDYLDLRARDVPHVRVGGLGRSVRPADDLRALRRIVREMRSFRPHIVHTHTAKAGVLGRLAASVARVPVTVHTFHGHLLHGYFSSAKTRAVVMTERTLARRTTRLAAVGSRVRDDLLAAGIGRAEQYVVVPPGISLPPAPERARARRELGIDPRAAVVGFVARMTRVKRPDRFAEVAHLVAERCPAVVFLVAGEGELLGDLEGAVAALGDRVRFVGWRADVETVYAAADLVVLTSDNEGMPVSLIEAAMCGRAAVTTDVGSAAEVVTDGRTGRVVPADAHALAAAVTSLLARPDRLREMGERAVARARERFGAERLLADTVALYESLLVDRGLC
jgi:glycosyltransferase involved in cell wall biosynthesis